MGSVFTRLIVAFLLGGTLLQSCSPLIRSDYMPDQASPKVSSKPPTSLLGPDECLKNQVNTLLPTVPTNQIAGINLALEGHTLTAHTGQRVNFLRNSQGIWQALVHDPWTGSHSSIPIPVFCEQKSDIVSMLQNLYQQAPSTQKYKIHVLPSRQSQCIFLGNLGLRGGMRGQNEVGALALLEAVEQNALVLVKQILDSGIDPNIAGRHGLTPLHSAVLNNNLALVKLLLESYANPNVVDKDGFPPLAYAAKQGYLEVAKLLLVKNANPDGIAGEGEELPCSPLQLAIENGHVAMVKLLLDSNADVYMPDYYGNLPLQLAIEHQQKNIALVSLLLEHQVDPNVGDAFNITPLHVAAKCGYLDIVKMLLAKSADPNRVDEDGYTPLHIAAAQGYPAIAALLIDRYVQPWIDAWRSLHWAVAKGLISLVEELLETERDLDNTDYLGGFTPLLVAATLNRCEIGKMLLAKGADANQGTIAGLSPLQVAITNNYIEFLKLLLAAGVSLNIVDQYGYNPLHMATKYGYREIASLLLEQGADPNSFSGGGHTLVYTAAYYGQLDLVKFWLAQGLGLDSRNQGNNTNPLCAAAYRGHLNLVNFLLAKGADVHSYNQYGHTPLHLAAEGTHMEVVHSLLYGGADINAQNQDGNTFLHILADTQPNLFLKGIQTIEGHATSMLSQLQDILVEIFPTLSSTSNEDILAVVLDYAAGIKWDLKNRAEENIIDVLQDKESMEEEIIINLLQEQESLAKNAQQFSAIFKVVNRHQRLGGWYQTPTHNRVHAKRASLLQAQGVKREKAN
jgi:ankyrin repeat protein